MIKIKTSVLKGMVTKATKGATNDKIEPLTGMMLIEADGKRLTLVTTDGSNHLEVNHDLKTDEPFYVVVGEDFFTKLVMKLTTEEISLEITEGGLQVHADGQYMVSLPVDGEDQLIQFPKFDFGKKGKAIGKVESSLLKDILTTHKPNLLDNTQLPWLNSYYFDETGSFASNSISMCHNVSTIFKKPVLIQRNMMELVAMLDGMVTIYNNGGNYLFETKEVSIFGKTIDGVDKFPVGGMAQLMDSAFLNSCKVNRSKMLGAIGRVLMFTNAFDEDDIIIGFSEIGLQLANPKLSVVETVEYTVAPTSFDDYTCSINVNELKAQITSQECEDLELHYNNEVTIKMVDNANIYLVSLVDDEE